MRFRLIRAIAAALIACFAAAAFAAVDVNSATASDLDGVKGIGPAIAGRIVAERAKGPFKDWQDLVTRVKGVGQKTATEFSTGGLTVNGAAFAGAPAMPAASRTRAVPRAPTVAAPAVVAAVPATPPPAAPASVPTSTADRKAAAKAARDEKKAAKAAAVTQARQDRMAKPPGAASAASGAMR